MESRKEVREIFYGSERVHTGRERSPEYNIRDKDLKGELLCHAYFSDEEKKGLIMQLFLGSTIILCDEHGGSIL